METFQQVQQQFIDHIKDPQAHPEANGIADVRMTVYRDLFFNNIRNFVSSGFPVLHQLYSTDQWTKLVRKFFIEHDCQSPYFVDISKSFVDYLLDAYQPTEQDPPFLIELAHYEWVELNVSIRIEQHCYPYILWSEISTSPMVLSETAWPLSYGFAVHQISSDFRPEHEVPGGIHLIVYRDQEDEVQFMQINGVTALLMQLLTANPAILIEQLCQLLIANLPQFSSEQICHGAMEVLEKLVERGIIRRHSAHSAVHIPS